MSIRSYRDLEVYRRSIDILPRVHQLIMGLPSYEQRELASQMRRASKSIALNVAEGYGRRKSEKDFKCFVSTAMGSANEMLLSVNL
jgi:four helix bundle protein